MELTWPSRWTFLGLSLHSLSTDGAAFDILKGPCCADCVLNPKCSFRVSSHKSNDIQNSRVLSGSFLHLPHPSTPRPIIALTRWLEGGLPEVQADGVVARPPERAGTWLGREEKGSQILTTALGTCYTCEDSITDWQQTTRKSEKC